ncbi:hypothetical protein ACIBX9_31395 [Streptomyces albidoflavus]
MTTPPTSPREALAHTLATFADEPDTGMAVVATRNQPVRGAVTGLTWGDLRALAVGPPQVWLLMQGEDHEGGDVLGVFVTREAARGEFIAAARRLHFEIDGAEEREDGSLHLHAGCDWLSLTPHAVATAEAIEAGESR